MSVLFDHSRLFDHLRSTGLSDWADELHRRCRAATELQGHGNLDTWRQAWESLPDCGRHPVRCVGGRVTIGDTQHVSEQTSTELRRRLMEFHPWRKGPFELFGIHIDTEWRSDWKWERLKTAVPLEGCRVLDVGCGNGYYGWQMLAAGAKLVMGLDPFLLYVMQHEVIRRFAPVDAANFVLPLGDDCLPPRLQAFDVTFSMGVLYHRTSPIDHLQALAATLKPKGRLVLETIIIDADDERVLVPEGRYAKMRNVWFLPSVPMLKRWLQRTGFRNITVVDQAVTTLEEQRRTDWMTFESLGDFLDPQDRTKTIEGYPAPVRVVMTAETA
ncbi:MAG: tRNA 5-methoxyuridine(34)/uridine 5-oxyacetic acid(34) synthase CmoB [Planctomycetaceae bacterium]